MSVCATCLEPGIRDQAQHDCPGLGDIQLTRRLGHGLIVEHAPPRARMALTVLANAKWGATMASNDQINVADQVLYQVVGYDLESASLVLELVEDWRQAGILTFDHRLSKSEVEEIKARWRERYGKPGTCNHEPTGEQP